MNSINGVEVQLGNAMRKLQYRWTEARSKWNDKVSRDFEKIYWTPLENEVEATMQQMHQLAEIIDQAHRSVR
jgi:hypothetical protein